MPNWFGYLQEKIDKSEYPVQTEYILLTQPGSLSKIRSGEIDYIWSSDAITRAPRREIESYFTEFKRILKPGGVGLIHIVDDHTRGGIPEGCEMGGYSISRTTVNLICERQGLKILAFEEPFKLGVFVVIEG